MRYGATLPRPAVPEGPLIYSPYIPEQKDDEPPQPTPLMHKLGVSSLLGYARTEDSPAWEDAFLFATPRRRPPLAHDPGNFMYLCTYFHSEIARRRFGISTFDLQGDEGPIITLERRTF